MGQVGWGGEVGVGVMGGRVEGGKTGGGGGERRKGKDRREEEWGGGWSGAGRRGMTC